MGPDLMHVSIQHEALQTRTMQDVLKKCLKCLIYIGKTSDFLRIAFATPRQHWGECRGQCHCDFSDEFYWEVWEKCLLSSAPNIEFYSHLSSLTFYLAGFVMVQTQRASYHSYPQPSKDYLRTLRQQWSCTISLVLQSNEFWPILHHNIETEMPECATVCAPSRYSLVTFLPPSLLYKAAICLVWRRDENGRVTRVHFSAFWFRFSGLNWQEPVTASLSSPVQVCKWLWSLWTTGFKSQILTVFPLKLV